MKPLPDTSRPGSGNTVPPRRPDNPARPKALVVDDEGNVLESTAAVIETLGYEVLRADGGEAAVTLMKTHPDITMLFTDVLMPGISGVQLGRTARSLIPNIDVILVSGYPATAMEAEDGKPQEFKFLMKPVEASEIALVLRRLGALAPQQT